MRGYLRKVAPAKWKKPTLPVSDYPADAITGCTRTRNNTLSLWAVSDQADIEDAILAIALAGTRIDKIDYVILSPEEISNISGLVKKTEGQTPIASIANKHHDICDLTYVSLGQVAEVIKKAVLIDDKVQICTRKEVFELIKRAINLGKCSLSQLDSSIADSYKDMAGDQI